jgi:nucleotide-binding universal stress UspA family protein
VEARCWHALCFYNAREEQAMLEIDRILVPIDFSDHAQRAVDEAVLFAKAFGAELHLLHCYRFLPEILELYGVEKPKSFEADVAEAARKRMAEWSEAVEEQGVAVQSHLVASLPSKEIVDLAVRIRASMIAMGTRGLSGLKQVVLGSVAERVIRLAPCPVLTARREDGAPAHAQPRRIAKILVPVDFSEDSQQAFDVAIDVAKTFGAEIHLVHCYQIYPASVSPYGVVVPENLEQDIRMAALQRLAEWREKATALGIRAQEHITAHFPSEEIVAMSERLAVHLIVMGSRGLTGLKHVLLGSVAERTIRNATCPVLTVKKSD